MDKGGMGHRTKGYETEGGMGHGTGVYGTGSYGTPDRRSNSFEDDSSNGRRKFTYKIFQLLFKRYFLPFFSLGDRLLVLLRHFLFLTLQDMDGDFCFQD